MTQIELNEFEAENDELIAMFQRRKPTMDTVERMFPGLYRDPEVKQPMVDDMEIEPFVFRPKLEISREGAAIFTIYAALIMVMLVVLMGWTL